jgi:trk system potassium uptake protein TrkA
MYIIIAGCGTIGQPLVKLLLENGHDVVVIDKNAEVCEEVYAEMGALTVNGNATDLRILKQAGAEKADAITCLMYSSADNIACSLLAKSLGIPRVISRLRHPTYEEAYRLAGVNSIVRMADLLINQIMMEIEQPEVRKVTSIGGGKADIYAVKIPLKSKAIGMSVKDIGQSSKFPEECVIMGIYRVEKDEFFIPRGNNVIQQNDELFLVSKSQHIKAATDFLVRKTK